MKQVAVFFGGKSVEHDVSILTGLEMIQNMDTEKYAPFPVYVDREGNWWTGASLLDRKTYPLNASSKRKLKQVDLQKGVLKERGIFGKTVPVDIVMNGFHGTQGEDGCFQGVLEMAGLAYTGPRVADAAITMNKATTKKILREAGVPVLPDVVLSKPAAPFSVAALSKQVTLKFPVIVKPCNLGSSIGVYKAANKKELEAALLTVFAMDEQIIIEPFVVNLEEYNVSVSQAFGGEVRTSVIERPLRKAEVLDFKTKYQSGGSKSKMGGGDTSGLLAATRDFDPKSLTPKQKKDLASYAKAAFVALGCKGNPRIDFLYDKKSKKMVLCEVNTLPGSFSAYLWERATPKVNATKLISALLEEALSEQQKQKALLRFTSSGTLFGND